MEAAAHSSEKPHILKQYVLRLYRKHELKAIEETEKLHLLSKGMEVGRTYKT